MRLKISRVEEFGEGSPPYWDLEWVNPSFTVTWWTYGMFQYSQYKVTKKMSLNMAGYADKPVPIDVASSKRFLFGYMPYVVESNAGIVRLWEDDFHKILADNSWIKSWYDRGMAIINGMARSA